MTLAMVVDIVLNPQVVHTMDRCTTVKRLMNSIATHVRLGHLANHMVVDGVPSELEGLADVEELHVLDAAYHRLVAWRVQHDCCSVLVR